MREKYIKKLLAEGWKQVTLKGQAVPCYTKDGEYIYIAANRIIRTSKKDVKK